MTEFFFILLFSGLILTGAEIFIPGGVLGVLGGCALCAALIVGFYAYPGYGTYIALAIIFAMTISFILWAKFFPSTRIGRSMTLATDGADFDGTDLRQRDLLGKTGEVSSDCRPAGYAVIDGRRVDVITEGGMIDKGTPVTVVAVEGNRIVVRARKAATSGDRASAST